jgi:hypothetical protein
MFALVSLYRPFLPGGKFYQALSLTLLMLLALAIGFIVFRTLLSICTHKFAD